MEKTPELVFWDLSNQCQRNVWRMPWDAASFSLSPLCHSSISCTSVFRYIGTIRFGTNKF